MEQKVINLLGIRKRVILAHFEGFKKGEVAVMDAITEDEEHTIDAKSVHYLSDGRMISKESIYFYGDINIENENDIALIRKKNLINENVQIRSNFDYEKGNHKVLDQVRCSPCSDPVEWFKYNYCLLGKPAKVVVFKMPRIYL